MEETLSRCVDLAFDVQGHSLPREHRRALAAALLQALPWLDGVPGAGVHRLNVAAGGGPRALLSQRTRLTLRLPRDCAGAAAALAGRGLPLDGATLQLGGLHQRELLPHGTLYAHLVAADSDDEAAFMRAVQQELAALGVAARPICGRHQSTEGAALEGYGLMLDGLSRGDALRVMEAGIGAHRLWGCGVFVPHKSAAAVGTVH